VPVRRALRPAGGRRAGGNRNEYEARLAGPQARAFLFGRLLPSPALLTAPGAMLYLYQASGLQRVASGYRAAALLGPLGDREALLPDAEIPFFFREYGKTFPAIGTASDIAWRSWRAASPTSPSRD
jgi:hypothetical protein